MDQIETLLERATVLKDVRKYSEAIKILNEILAIDPGHQEAMRQLCLCTLYKGNIIEARIVADRILALNAASDQAYFFRGEMNYETGYYEEAIEMINEAIRINPENLSYIAGKAKYYPTIDNLELGPQSIGTYYVEYNNTMIKLED